MRFADLDAVTLDAFGTLLELIDPVPLLEEALRERGAEHEADQIRAAFRAEGAYYRAHVSEGRDEHSLRRLRVECATVFLETLGEDLDAEEFAPAYVGSLRFRLLEGVDEALHSLRARGLELAVVGNWDVGLHDHLRELGVTGFFRVVLPVAEKPSPSRLLEALELLGVTPGRALHIGDEPADEEAARAAGMHFLHAPLPDAVARLE